LNPVSRSPRRAAGPSRNVWLRFKSAKLIASPNRRVAGCALLVELGLSTLQEGLGGLAGAVPLPQLVDAVSLASVVFDRLVGLAVDGGGLGSPNRGGIVLRDRTAQAESYGLWIVRQFGGEPEFGGPLAGQLLAGVGQPAGDAVREDGAKGAVAADEAHVDLGAGDVGVGRQNAIVAERRDIGAGPDRGTVDRGDQ